MVTTDGYPLGSALSTLESGLADLESDQLSLSATTPAALYASLVDDLWWRVCAEAVLSCPDRLLAWCNGMERPVADIFRGQSAGRSGGETALDNAKAVAAIGVALAAARGELPARDGELAIRSSIAYWSTTNTLPVLSAQWPLPDPPADQEAGRALLALNALPAGSARSHVAFLIMVMASSVAVRPFGRGVHVLFDDNTSASSGSTGLLRVAAVADGPSGLHPDPRTMSFLRADPRFATALTSAWRYSVGDVTSGPCLVWSLARETERGRPINGGSLGLAFAAAMSDLLRPPLRRYLSLTPFRAFNATSALTGTVESDGSVGEVGGLPGKFEVAASRGWRVIAPAANRVGYERSLPDGLTVHWVRSVAAARTKAMRWEPRRVALALVLVVALVVAFGIRSIVLDRLTADDSKVTVADTDNLAENLLDQSVVQRARQPVFSIRLGLAAVALDDTAQTRAELIGSLTAPRSSQLLLSGQGAILGLAFGRDGRVLIADDLGATLIDTSNFSQPRQLGVVSPGTQVVAAAMTDDANTVIVAVNNPGPELEVWQANDGAHPAETGGVALPCPVVAVAVSSARPIALTGCANGTAILWNINSNISTVPTELATLTPAAAKLHSVTLDGNGDVAAVGSDQGLAVWNISSPMKPRRITQDYAQTNYQGPSNPLPVYSVAASADGNALLAGEVDSDTEVAQRDTASSPVSDGLAMNDAGVVTTTDLTPDARFAITGNEGNNTVVWRENNDDGPNRYTPYAILRQANAFAVALSPDGRTAVVGDTDGNAVLWDLFSPDFSGMRSTITQSASAVDMVRCSGRTSICAAAGADGHVVLWDLSDPDRPQRRAQLTTTGAVGAVAFAPDGRTVAVDTGYGTTLWDVSDPSDPIQLAALGSQTEGADAVAFSPNGQILVVGGSHTEVSCWDIGDLYQPRLLSERDPEPDVINAMAIDRTGRILATGGQNGTVYLTDITDPSDPEPVATLPGQSGSVRSLAFNPHSAQLIQVNDSGQSPVVWDLTHMASPTLLAHLTGHTDDVTSVQYDGAGTMAVATSRDDTAIVWNLTDPSQPTSMATLTGHQGWVLTAAFSPDASTLITGSTDDSMIVWDIRSLAAITANPVASACQEAGGAFSPQDWQKWVSPTILPIKNC